ncbi:MarC family protein [Sulfurospirillum arcachonense]|uniref:MarC family protein n=1 Tax=Sulfurospirillum arcachonense TaxID=57666 RepID=UPI00046A9D78|nr:MarC family protein [Sulfurospirillum arcachonense]
MSSEFSIIGTAILFMFILDPFGNVPLLLAILKGVDKKRKKYIIMRESFFGLAILLLFFFFGETFLNIFHLETPSVTIAGGVIFFVIAMRMIFPGEKGNTALFGSEEPFMVPIAIPLIAGPSALATLMIMTRSYSSHFWALFVSVILAWAFSTFILYMSPFLYKVLKEKGLNALEKLMGMLLLMLSVQMFVDGIRALFH